MKRCASLVLGSILLSFASLAAAQAWPSKPIK